MNKNIMNGFEAKHSYFDEKYVVQIKNYISVYEKAINKNDIDAIIKNLNDLEVGFSNNLMDIILNKIGEDKDVRQYFFDEAFKYISDMQKNPKYEIDYKDDVKNHFYVLSQNIMRGFQYKIATVQSYTNQILEHISQTKKNIESKIEIDAIIFELKNLKSCFNKDLINIVLGKIVKNEDIKRYFFDSVLNDVSIINQEDVKKYLLKLSGKLNVMIDFNAVTWTLTSYANQIVNHISDLKRDFTKDDIDAIISELKKLKSGFNKDLIDKILEKIGGNEDIKRYFFDNALEFISIGSKNFDYEKENLDDIKKYLLECSGKYNIMIDFKAKDGILDKSYAEQVNGHIMGKKGLLSQEDSEAIFGFASDEKFQLNKEDIDAIFIDLKNKKAAFNKNLLQTVFDNIDDEMKTYFINQVIDYSKDPKEIIYGKEDLSNVFDFILNSKIEFNRKELFDAMVNNKTINEINKFVNLIEKLNIGFIDVNFIVDTLKKLDIKINFDLVTKIVEINPKNLDVLLDSAVKNEVYFDGNTLQKILDSNYDFSGKALFTAMSRNGQIKSLQDVIKFCDQAETKIESLDLWEIIYFLSSWTYEGEVLSGISNLINNADNAKDTLSLANWNFIISLIPDNYLSKNIKNKIADVNNAELVHINFYNIEEAEKSIDSIKLFYEKGVLNYLEDPEDRKKVFSFVIKQLKKSKMMDYMFSFIQPVEIDDKNKEYVDAMREIFDNTVPNFIDLAEKCMLRTLENKDSIGMFLNNLKLMLGEIKNIGSDKDKGNIETGLEIEAQDNKQDGQASVIENTKIRKATIEIVNKFVEVLKKCIEVNEGKDALADLNNLIPTLKEIIEINNIYQSEKPNLPYLIKKIQNLVARSEKILKDNPETLKIYKEFLDSIFNQAKENVNLVAGDNLINKIMAKNLISNVQKTVINDNGITKTLENVKGVNLSNGVKFLSHFMISRYTIVNIIVIVSIFTVGLPFTLLFGLGYFVNKTVIQPLRIKNEATKNSKNPNELSK